MKRILAAAVLTAVTSLSANAALTATGSTPVTFSGTFDPTPTFIVLPTFTSGLLNSPITTTAGTVTATFLGKEALDTDNFAFSMGGMLLNTGMLGASISQAFLPGALAFSFTDMTTGNASASYAVLGSFSGGTFTPYTTAAYQLILGFNDGLAVDGDYDDMVIGLSVSAVPEPEAYALMLAGIGAVGFIARRRRKLSV